MDLSRILELLLILFVLLFFIHAMKLFLIGKDETEREERFAFLRELKRKIERLIYELRKERNDRDEQ